MLQGGEHAIVTTLLEIEMPDGGDILAISLSMGSQGSQSTLVSSLLAMN